LVVDNNHIHLKLRHDRGKTHAEQIKNNFSPNKLNLIATF